MAPLFSIITSCYNSTGTLWATYQSLLKQSYTNFEWILVDDASTDAGLTKQLIERIVKEAPFKVITYFFEDNHFGSKSTLIGCSIASGVYIGLLDHDDQFPHNAMEKAAAYIEKYGKYDDIAGICGRCIDENGKLIGKKFVADQLIASEPEIRFKQKITCELFQFSKLEIIRPFFELMKPGYTNGFVWANISKKFKYVYVNDIFRVYDTGLATSYSNNRSMKISYPVAKAEAIKKVMMIYWPYFKYNPLYGARIIASYLRHNINGEINFSHAVSEFSPILKVCCVFLYPLAIIKSKGWLK